MPGARISQLRTLLVSGAILAMPAVAVAMPYCVQTQAIPPQCIYLEPGPCQQRATQMGGSCTVNPAEVQVTHGLGHYCLITPGQITQCMFTDEGPCVQEAQRQNGACIQEPNRPESPTPDPYREIRPSMAGG